ncbi:MAG: alpha-glucosidase [Spirochaetia bacterium]|nr:alpha-glucosidase [Spirochaetia bacterium]
MRNLPCYFLSLSIISFICNCAQAPSGKLVVETTGTIRLGTFEVAVESSPPRLRIGVPGNPSLWSSLPGVSFINAAHGEAAVKESRGSFNIKDSIKSFCTQQSIASMDSKSDRLIIKGELACTGGEPRIPYQLTFQNTGNQLRFEARIDSKLTEINRVYLTLASDKTESFFGFGEQFTYFDLKGREVPILTQEQGVGRGTQPITIGANLTAGAGGDWHTTYISVPQFITSKGRSLFLENSEHSIFDLRQDDSLTITVHSSTATGRILFPGTPLELVESYTQYSGRMRPLPDWVHRGAIVGMQGGTNVVKKALAELDAQKAPVAAFWLQDWVGQRTTNFGKQLWWNWELDRDRYPGWDELLADLKLRDIRVMSYVNPFIADVAGKKTNVRRNLFAEASSRGYLIRHGDGSPYLILNTDFSAAMIDLTNPEARRWMKDVIKTELIASGVSGWMADFGEALPFDAKLYSGESAASYHNRYPEEWAALNREAASESNRNDIVFFCRSGFTKSPGEATLFWLGDQMVDWDENDGIKSSITGVLSGGISGFSLNHSDIGGYTTINNPLKNYHRSKELLLRWSELGAFQTVYRSHEGNRPDENHQFNSDAETLKHFVRFAKIHAAWFEYRKQLMEEASRKGWPVMRHLYLHYPEDPEVRRIRFEEFLVGSEILVAPVLDPDTRTVSVYLPRGEWVHIWTGDVKGSTDSGTRIVVDAPIGKPAVFFKKGSVPGQAFRKELEKQGLL